MGGELGREQGGWTSRPGRAESRGNRPRIGRASGSVDRSSCADVPWRAQTMNATESASAFRCPWLPVCLGQVPDVRDAALVTPAVVLLIVFGGPAVSLLARIGKDLDAFFIPVDLSPCRTAYPLTRVAPGTRDEISRTFAQFSPGSRAAASRHLAQSSAVRTSWAACY